MLANKALSVCRYRIRRSIRATDLPDTSKGRHQVRVLRMENCTFHDRDAEILRAPSIRIQLDISSLQVSVTSAANAIRRVEGMSCPGDAHVNVPRKHASHLTLNVRYGPASHCYRYNLTTRCSRPHGCNAANENAASLLPAKPTTKALHSHNNSIAFYAKSLGSVPGVE